MMSNSESGSDRARLLGGVPSFADTTFEITAQAPPMFKALAGYRKMQYSPLMRLISNKALRDFAKVHPVAEGPLQGWRRIVERGQYRNFADLKRAFNSIDKAGDYFVFDIAGNKYRLIAAIHFNTQILYVRSVLTHAEYDEWRP